MSVVKLYLFRHGEVENSESKVFNGHRDVSLSGEGVRQFEEISKRLKKKKIDAVYSSDLLRTKAGATLIASPHNLEVDTFSELREVCFGHWEGMNVDSVLQRFPDELACRAADFFNHRIKNGESLLDLKERVIPCVKNMVLSHPGGSIVCVSHSGVNRIILLWALSGSYEKIYSIKQEYACLNILNFFEDGHVEIEKMNTFLF